MLSKMHPLWDSEHHGVGWGTLIPQGKLNDVESVHRKLCESSISKARSQDIFAI